jgi:hypothetical protein
VNEHGNSEKTHIEKQKQPLYMLAFALLAVCSTTSLQSKGKPEPEKRCFSSSVGCCGGGEVYYNNYNRKKDASAQEN